MQRADIASLASLQFGLVARWQVDPDGPGRAHVDAMVRSGHLHRVGHGLYSFGGHGDSWFRRLWAAHLGAGPGSAVSHEGAARVHGLTQFAPTVAVTVPGHRMRDLADAVVHRSTDLIAGDVVSVGGLPVTSLARTLVDLGSVSRHERLRKAVEQAILEKRVAAAEVGVVLDRVRRRGKPGIAVAEEVLDAVGPGHDLPRSELEGLMDRVIELAGLPRPEHEHPLPSCIGRPGFVDRCWVEQRWILEGDGRLWHARHQQMRIDADRMNEASALGFATNRLHWEPLAHDPHGTARLLRAIFHERCRHFPLNSSSPSAHR